MFWSIRHHAVSLIIGALIFVMPLSAETTGEALSRVLRMDESVAVLRDEGLQNSRKLDQDMLSGTGGVYFANRIDEIYDPVHMEAVIMDALTSGLDEAEAAATIAFFETGLGQRIITLENSARTAISDSAVEEMARQAYQDRKGTDDARLAAVARFIAVNDLVERNVAGTLSSDYQFFSGLADGGLEGLDEETIISDVWSQETEVREDTEDWIFGFLLLAYRPLSHADLDAYTRFSETDAGQALNTALFAGFDEMYRTISYRLGQTVAQAMGSSDI